MLFTNNILDISQVNYWLGCDFLVSLRRIQGQKKDNIIIGKLLLDKRNL